MEQVSLKGFRFRNRLCVQDLLSVFECSVHGEARKRICFHKFYFPQICEYEYHRKPKSSSRSSRPFYSFCVFVDKNLCLTSVAMFKTVPAIYRDCLKLINHVAGRTAKGVARFLPCFSLFLQLLQFVHSAGDMVRNSVRQQFKINKDEKDEKKIIEVRLARI